MDHVRLSGARGQTALAIVLTALTLTACNDEQDRAAGAAGAAGAAHTGSSAPVASTPPPAASSTSTPSAPQVSGSPRTQVVVNQLYEFMPTARDPNGDRLAFSIAHRPAWLKFSVTTGLLSGTPTVADVGVYRGITIAVTDGNQAKALLPFDIQVVAVGPSSVILSWAAPTQNEDGSPLTDLAGYRIRYGERSGSYSTTVALTNPGLASHFLDGLVPSTYYFVISAYNARGEESPYSNEAVITL